MRIRDKNKGFVYACGSFLFSLLPAGVSMFLPTNQTLKSLIGGGIIVLVTVLGSVFPDLGKNLTKLFAGWTASGYPDGGGEGSVYMAQILSKDEDPYTELKPKKALYIVLIAGAIFLFVWLSAKFNW